MVPRYNGKMGASTVIRVDPQVQNGTPCFAGTRVPVQSLFDALTHGRTVDEFLEHFPSVTRDQALAVLHDAAELIGTRPEVPRAA
jgi:uncharacterized protein (DUF433 family)